MPSKDVKNFDQYQKSIKEPFLVYADFECIIKKMKK